MCSVDPERLDKIIDYFPIELCLWTVGQHCTGNFLVRCWPVQIKRRFYKSFSCQKMTRALDQHCPSNFHMKCCLMYLDNITQIIYLLNNIAQGFYLYNIAQMILRQQRTGFFLKQCCVEPQRAILHKVFHVQCCNVFSGNIIAQIKTMCSVVFEAPDNNTQEIILFNFVLILLGQHCPGPKPMQCCLRASRQHWTGKILCKIVLILLGQHCSTLS